MTELNINVEELLNESTSKITKTKEKVNTDEKMDEDLLRMSLGKLDPKVSQGFLYRTIARERLNFEVPYLIKDDFLKLAIEKGLVTKKGKPDQKRCLYYCLRLAGISIPDDIYLDARRVDKIRLDEM